MDTRQQSIKDFIAPLKGSKALYAAPLAARFTDLRGIFRADLAQIADVVGTTFAARIWAITQAAQIAAEPPRPTEPLSSPEVAAEYFQARLSRLQVEEVHAAYVTARNYLIVAEIIQRGTVDQSVVYPREIMRRAMLHNASGFVLAHNHPGGDPAPSAQDRQLTDLLYQAAKPLGIRFLDHIVVGGNSTANFSFRNHGLMPTL
jgi:DNA repair protein RadC